MELDVTMLSKDAAPLVRALAEPFTSRADALGLAAAVAWGFGAAPDFRKGWDGVEVALVFTGTPPLTVEALLGAGRLPAGKRAAFAPPLILTLEEIRASLDVYPVEFLAIRETGQVVAGALDLAETFPVAAADLRSQAEREWRGILFNARAALLGSGGAPRDLAEIAVSDYVIKYATSIVRASRPKDERSQADQGNGGLGSRPARGAVTRDGSQGDGRDGRPLQRVARRRAAGHGARAAASHRHQLPGPGRGAIERIDHRAARAGPPRARDPQARQVSRPWPAPSRNT